MEVILGTIVGVFGLNGEVKVKSNTDFAKIRYKKGNEVILYSPISKTQEKVKILHYKTSVKGLDILSFNNLNDPETAKKYIGYQILIEKPQDDLKGDNYYYADLWNSDVYHNDVKIGKVIDLFDAGSHVILRIQREGKKDLLYPFVDKFIKEVNTTQKIIIISPIEGMVD